MKAYSRNQQNKIKTSWYNLDALLKETICLDILSDICSNSNSSILQNVTLVKPKRILHTPKRNFGQTQKNKKYLQLVERWTLAYNII